MWGAKTADDGSPRRTDAVRGPDEMPGAHGRRRVRRRGDGPRRPGVCASFSERPLRCGEGESVPDAPAAGSGGSRVPESPGPGRGGAGDRRLRDRRVPAGGRRTGAVARRTGRAPLGDLLGRRAGRDLRRGQWRAGGTLVARGEFSIVIAGLAVGVEPRIGPPATADVLILVVLGPLAARWTEPLARRLARGAPGASRPARQRRRSPPKQSTRAAESGGRMPHGAPRRAHL